MAEKFFFIVFAVLAVAGALGVITRSNIVHALLLLVFTFLNVAAIYMLTQAYFLAVIQVLVYAGAILVLFAFVVMFLNLREFMEQEQLHRSQKWVVLVLAPIMLAEFVFVALGITWASVNGGMGPEAVAGRRGQRARRRHGALQRHAAAVRGGVADPPRRHGGRHRAGQEGGCRQHVPAGVDRRRRVVPSPRGPGGLRMNIPVDWYLILSAFLFVIGAAGVMARRNMFIVLFSIELMMNAVNLNLVGFSRFHENLIGQNFVLFTMTVAAAEAAVGLAIVTALFRNKKTLMVDLFDTMKG